MTQQDSIQTPALTTGDSVVRPATYGKPQTPFQVLRLLPKDATPAQQDSAIQAWYQPAEIHYSEQPDTLHLPGEGVPRDLKAVNMPEVKHQEFFFNDSLMRAEIGQHSYGEPGTPPVNAIFKDDLVGSLFIVCLLGILLIYSLIDKHLLHQAKYFFHTQKGQYIRPSGTEVQLEIMLTFITCVLATILYYIYTLNYVGTTFILWSNYWLLPIFLAMFTAYYALRFGLYALVHYVFFTNEDHEKFSTSLLFLSACESVMILPAIPLIGFFEFSPKSIVIYGIVMLILVKMLTIYKSYEIFFKQKHIYLQIILYFCALEAVPFFLLFGGLATIVGNLIIKF